MTVKLPRLTAREIITVIEKVGFVLIRQSGSHKIYKNKKSRRITVPFHSNKTLHPKILKSIIKDAEISVKELKNLL